jgi:hypothetical protein
LLAVESIDVLVGENLLCGSRAGVYCCVPDMCVIIREPAAVSTGDPGDPYGVSLDGEGGTAVAATVPHLFSGAVFCFFPKIKYTMRGD